MKPIDLKLLQSDFGDISAGTFSVIKEPMGTYFIGLPFNKTGQTYDDILGFLLDAGYTIPRDTLDSLKNMEDYQMLTFSLISKELVKVKVHYLYSRPSAIEGGKFSGISDTSSSGD